MAPSLKDLLPARLAAPDSARHGGAPPDRRSQTRRGERLPIRYWDPTASATYQGVLINGSDGGAFIETNDSLPLLTKIRIEGPGVLCHAQVCRVHWLGPEERVHSSGGMAVRIISSESRMVDADYEDHAGPVLSFALAQTTRY